MPGRHPLLAGLLAMSVLAGVSAASVGAETASVKIDNFAFTPERLTVARGTTVSFTNNDDMPHTVTSAARPVQFKSPALDTGDHFEQTFDTPGTYGYFCSLHPHMQGTIVVK